MKLSTGEYLVRLLRAYDVDLIFGIPGVHTVELYRGLYGSGIRHITPRHEQGAGFMADGYARISGKPGVCFIISGPGMTNILTAMGQAYGDSIPMLVISTVNAHGQMGSGEGWLHELPNQSSMIAGVSAFSRTIHCAEELAPALAQAYAQFEGARPRPVHIEIPLNVILSSADHLPEPKRAPEIRPPAPSNAIAKQAAEMLSNAKAPLILAGGGSVSAATTLQKLAEKIDAPIVMTTNARGIVPSDHPLGVSLSPSMPETRRLAAQSDVVLAIGTEFGPTDYDFYEDGGFLLTGDLIRVDIDPVQIRRGPAADLAIVADALEATSAISQMVEAQCSKSGRLRATETNAGTKQLSNTVQSYVHILNTIRTILPDAIIVGDQTQLVYAGNTAFSANTPGSYFNSATGFGTLGYGMPAAVGASLAAPDCPVIALIGDGGFQFSIAELASATEAGVRVIAILYNNYGYGEIKSYMEDRDITPIGVDILTPDFKAIAIACGWTVEEAATLKHLSDLLTQTKTLQAPQLIIVDDTLIADAKTEVLNHNAS